MAYHDDTEILNVLLRVSQLLSRTTPLLDTADSFYGKAARFITRE